MSAVAHHYRFTKIFERHISIRPSIYILLSFAGLQPHGVAMYLPNEVATSQTGPTRSEQVKVAFERRCIERVLHPEINFRSGNFGTRPAANFGLALRVAT